VGCELLISRQARRPGPTTKPVPKQTVMLQWLASGRRCLGPSLPPTTGNVSHSGTLGTGISMKFACREVVATPLAERSTRYEGRLLLRRNLISIRLCPP
jgi:hypothetical protein